MPTSPRSKIHRINNAFRQIRNILHRADVGIGPYDNLLRQSQSSREAGAFSCLANPMQLVWRSPLPLAAAQQEIVPSERCDFFIAFFRHQ